MLNRICREHGIEPLPPEKSRGTIECEEYREQRRKAEQLAEKNEKATTELSETREELEKAAKKKTKLVEIDSIETGKTMFGGKVTMSKEDYETLTDLAKKQVASTKETKRLKSENADLRDKNSILEQQVQGLSAELAEYKKPAMFSREKLKQSNQRISETENLRSQVRKYQAFIDACGLSDDFKKYTRNKSRNTEVK